MHALARLGIATLLLYGSLNAPAQTQEIAGNAQITGAGSTFAFPIMARWAREYHRWKAGGGNFPVPNSGLEDPPTGPVLDYEPSGSLAGTMRAREAAIDFGASDAPLTSAELAKLGLGQFPVVIGGIVAAVNLDSVSAGDIKFTGPVLADIFLGKIQNWNDQAIKALNPTLKLPDSRIIVVRRSDGSGTTYNFTSYLSKVSSEWRDTVGADLQVKWPVGLASKGNSGVAQTIRETANSIGYVEYAQALQAKLAYASVQNRAGKFVRPDTVAFQAAASGATWNGGTDFDQLLIDAPGDTAYPITATVFAQMKKTAGSQRSKAVLDFFQWSLDRGAADAAQLGYVPLPSALVSDIKKYWSSSFKFSG